MAPPHRTTTTNRCRPDSILLPRRYSTCGGSDSRQSLLLWNSKARTSSSDVALMNEPRPKKKVRSSTPKKQYYSSPEAFAGKSMLNHDILSKEQEHQLGLDIQKALFYQKKLMKFLMQPTTITTTTTTERPLLGVSEKLPPVHKQPGRPRGKRNISKQQTNNMILNPQRINDEIAPWEERVGNANDDNDETINLSIYGLEVLESQKNVDSISDGLYRSNNASWRKNILDRTKLKRSSSSRTKDDDGWNMNAMALLGDKSLNDDAKVKEVFGLDRAELREIFARGAWARDTLIRNNIRLVVNIAKKWAKQQQGGAGAGGGSGAGSSSLLEGSWDRPSLDEAIQEGILGLTKAVERFEPQRNLRFSTYATLWIVNSVRRCFQMASTPAMRVPTGYHEKRSRFRALVKTYHDAGREVPPLEELAQQMNLNPARLEFILEITKPALSMDAPLSKGGITHAGKAGNVDLDDASQVLGSTLVDPKQTSPEYQVELNFLRQTMENAMASELVPHERDIVRLRLGLDDGISRTVTQVVEEYGGALSNQDVRSAESRAYKKLRSPRTLSTYNLLAYLDFCGIDKADTTLLR